ncbi:hypothetical protein [Alkalinema sp. FACHB-956]|uniref:hypothetical protein n=1 Tax=Alkalinema sp. FACHB-956 TaxID=2692768 RepID=UPI00321FF03A
MTVAGNQIQVNGSELFVLLVSGNPRGYATGQGSIQQLPLTYPQSCRGQTDRLQKLATLHHYL